MTEFVASKTNDFESSHARLGTDFQDKIGWRCPSDMKHGFGRIHCPPQSGGLFTIE